MAGLSLRGGIRSSDIHTEFNIRATAPLPQKEPVGVVLGFDQDTSSKTLLERGKSGLHCLTCCQGALTLDKQQKMDGGINLTLSILFL